MAARSAWEALLTTSGRGDRRRLAPFFDEYASGASGFDAGVMAHLWTFPALVTDPTGGRCFATREELEAWFAARFRAFPEANLLAVALRLTSTEQLCERVFIAHVEERFMDTDVEVSHVLRNVYLVRFTAEGPRIFALITDAP